MQFDAISDATPDLAEDFRKLSLKLGHNLIWMSQPHNANLVSGRSMLMSEFRTVSKLLAL